MSLQKRERERGLNISSISGWLVQKSGIDHWPKRRERGREHCRLLKEINAAAVAFLVRLRRRRRGYLRRRISRERRHTSVATAHCRRRVAHMVGHHRHRSLIRLVHVVRIGGWVRVVERWTDRRRMLLRCLHGRPRRRRISRSECRIIARSAVRIGIGGGDAGGRRSRCCHRLPLRTSGRCHAGKVGHGSGRRRYRR